MSRSCATSCKNWSTARTSHNPQVSTVHHVDAALLVLEKPAGLLSVPGLGPDKQDCLSARAQQQYADALIVHRLDMSTSGLMLMARGKAAQSVLSRHFAERRVHKRYEAIVHGAVAQTALAWNDIDLPIALDWPHRPLRIVSAVDGKPSQTRWRIVDRPTPSTTRLELEPVTGRSHQLRVHLKAIGHPIIGDPLYGTDDLTATSRLMLHATRIAFAHPVTAEPMSFFSAPDF